jgi:predicted DNA-binding transcriptional regulator AlpA
MTDHNTKAASTAQVPPTDALARKAERMRVNRVEARKFIADPLLTPQEAAAEVGIAVATWWKWVKLGRFPQPIYPLPKSPRWRRSEVRAALTSTHP